MSNQCNNINKCLVPWCSNNIKYIVCEDHYYLWSHLHCDQDIKQWALSLSFTEDIQNRILPIPHRSLIETAPPTCDLEGCLSPPSPGAKVCQAHLATPRPVCVIRECVAGTTTHPFLCQAHAQGIEEYRIAQARQHQIGQDASHRYAVAAPASPAPALCQIETEQGRYCGCEVSPGGRRCFDHRFEGEMCLIETCRNPRSAPCNCLCEDHDAAFSDVILQTENQAQEVDPNRFFLTWMASLADFGYNPPNADIQSWAEAALTRSAACEEEISALTDQLAAQAEVIDRLTERNASLEARLGAELLSPESEIAQAKAREVLAREEARRARAQLEALRRRGGLLAELASAVKAALS